MIRFFWWLVGRSDRGRKTAPVIVRLRATWSREDLQAQFAIDLAASATIREEACAAEIAPDVTFLAVCESVVNLKALQ